MTSGDIVPLIHRTTQIRLGIKIGISVAGVYSAFAILMRLLVGPEYAASTKLGVGGGVAAYLIAGIVGGAIAGLLWPLGKTLLGRMFVGVLVAWPAMIIFGWPLGSEMGWDGARDGFLLAVVLGPLCGAALWVVEHEAKKP